MSQKIKTLLLLPFLILSLNAVLAPEPVSAVSPACQIFVNDKSPKESQRKIDQCEAETPKECLGIDRSSKPGQENFKKCLINAKVDLNDNPIVKDIDTIVKFLSGLVAVVITGVLILGGIQYSMAGDKAEAVAAAKKRIVNALIALIVFLLIFSFLQWIIPGGIFSSAKTTP